MKCPKCNYVSFDYLTRCKKCGFVFKKRGATLPAFPGDEAMPREKKSPDVSKTMA